MLILILFDDLCGMRGAALRCEAERRPGQWQ